MATPANGREESGRRAASSFMCGAGKRRQNSTALRFLFYPVELTKVEWNPPNFHSYFSRARHSHRDTPWSRQSSPNNLHSFLQIPVHFRFFLAFGPPIPAWRTSVEAVQTEILSQYSPCQLQGDGCQSVIYWIRYERGRCWIGKIFKKNFRKRSLGIQNGSRKCNVNIGYEACNVIRRIERSSMDLSNPPPSPVRQVNSFSRSDRMIYSRRNQIKNRRDGFDWMDSVILFL